MDTALLAETDRQPATATLDGPAKGLDGRQQARHGLDAEPDKLTAPAGGTQAARPLDAGQALKLQAAVLSHERFIAAAAAFAGELATTLRFDQVAVGFLDNSCARVVALSQGVDFQSKAEAIRRIGEAMDEAIEQRSTVVHPASSSDRPRIVIAHAELVRRGAVAICTIPLVAHGRAFGAVTLQRTTQAPIASDEVARCEHLVSLVGPILHLKFRNEQRWLSLVREGTRAAWAHVREPGHVRAKAAVSLAAAALAALLFVPVGYNVSAPAHLEGAIQRALVAPVDGFLRQVHVRPGDAVVADQLMVELAEQELELERRKWESELVQHQDASVAALAKTDRTQYAINQAKVSEARAQLELVDQHLSRSRVRAPFDGVVIKGDLTQSLGAPVQRGEVLLTLAPANQYRLIVDVDERDVAAVRQGQHGQLALAALPDATLAFRVVRVTPVSNNRDGRNFFEAEATLDASASKALRPGLQGVAKIRADDRPLAWIWTHRFVDWLSLTLWSWGA